MAGLTPLYRTVTVSIPAIAVNTSLLNVSSARLPESSFPKSGVGLGIRNALGQCPGRDLVGDREYQRCFGKHGNWGDRYSCNVRTYGAQC